jgi:hypothetical protein
MGVEHRELLVAIMVVLLLNTAAIIFALYNL